MLQAHYNPLFIMLTNDHFRYMGVFASQKNTNNILIELSIPE